MFPNDSSINRICKITIEAVSLKLKPIKLMLEKQERFYIQSFFHIHSHIGKSFVRQNVFCFLHLIIIKKSNTVKPPVNDHPKRENVVIAYQMWSLIRVELQEVSRGEEVQTHLLLEEIVSHASIMLQCT